MKFSLYRMAKYFKALRQTGVFPFNFRVLRRLKLSEWLNFKLRRILRQRNIITCNDLCLSGLKS